MDATDAFSMYSKNYGEGLLFSAAARKNELCTMSLSSMQHPILLILYSLVCRKLGFPEKLLMHMGLFAAVLQINETCRSTALYCTI
jgi:hypothetical protein